MRVADGWKDYEVLDAGDGERLENWAGVRLVRPDPQVVWKTPRTGVWNTADAVYHRSAAGGGTWEYKRKIPEKWTVAYKDLTLIVSPTGFKHTGVFPEQAVNWDMYRAILAGTKTPARVLNLFAYTGGATLACAAAGAAVTHVDASRGMVAWARDNAGKSGLAAAPIRWIVDDCGKYVAREKRRASLYEGVIMDPPSYGRGPGGEVWKMEENIYDLLRETMGVLSSKPLFFAVNSYTSGLSPAVMEYMLRALFVPKLGGQVLCDEIGLPVAATGGVLPCGGTALWVSDAAAGLVPGL